MRIVTHIRISQAASLLGVSDDTVRRLIDAGQLSPVPGAAGPTVLDGAELAAYARRQAEQRDRAAGDPTGVARSARNRFVGLVTAITADTVMAQVDLQCGPHRVVSLMSAEAVRDLGLEVGSIAVAVVKATTVIVEVPRSGEHAAHVASAAQPASVAPPASAAQPASGAASASAAPSADRGALGGAGAADRAGTSGADAGVDSGRSTVDGTDADVADAADAGWGA
nr:TOBE domain-containing protein [Nakamurella aerolata]